MPFPAHRLGPLAKLAGAALADLDLRVSAERDEVADAEHPRAASAARVGLGGVGGGAGHAP